jgi:uncharacterized membrane protein
MGNVQSINDITRLVQDVQYTSALKGMTPTERENYFKSQRTDLMNNILSDRESTFQKVSTDAARNSAIQTSLFYYLQRNRDLKDIGSQFSNVNENSRQTAEYNNQLAKRQNEINEWTFNNKLDTLFVFQLLFIVLLLCSVLVYLQKAGFYNTALLGVLSGLLIFIIVVTIANRAMYTNNTRDKRYWNRRKFPTKELPGGSSECPT